MRLDAVAPGGLFLFARIFRTVDRMPAGREGGTTGAWLRPSRVRRTIACMARSPDSFQRRRPDTQVMYAVRYEDGRTAYIRVDPETARHGNLVVMDVARERQEVGELPEGTITSVKQVR